MTETPKKTKTKVTTPIGIIGAFITISNLAAVLGATKTTGEIQRIFAYFFVGFSTLTLIVFFAILWYRPHVLYPPSEYGKETDVTKFVTAMMMQPNALDETTLFSNIQKTVRNTLTSEQTISEFAKVLSPQVTDQVTESLEARIAHTLDATAHEVTEKVQEQSFFTIDLRPLFIFFVNFIGDTFGDFSLVGEEAGQILQLLYEPDRPLLEIFQAVNQALLPILEKSSISDFLWGLKDINTGRVFGSMRLPPDMDNPYPAFPIHITLFIADIKPGMRLEAFLIGHPAVG